MTHNDSVSSLLYLAIPLEYGHSHHTLRLFKRDFGHDYYTKRHENVHRKSRIRVYFGTTNFEMFTFLS